MCYVFVWQRGENWDFRLGTHWSLSF